MQAYEAIKILKMDRKEFLEKYDLKSHLSKIPPELEAELFGEEKKIKTEPKQETGADTVEAPALTADSAETEVVDVEIAEDATTGEKDECKQAQDGNDDGADSTVDIGDLDSSVDCPYDKDTIRVSIRGLGNKSPCWKWRHILDG